MTIPTREQAIRNLREWAFAIEQDDWYAWNFLRQHNLEGRSFQEMFFKLTGLSDDRLNELFPDYSASAFLMNSEPHGILFRLFLAEAMESGDI